jgi:YbgC/YbaW family acyl-CoA thioester hydrolase
MDKNPNSVYTIRFNDCDLFGHLNNARYIDYFLNAREDHLKEYHNLNLTEYYKKDLAWLVGGHEIAYLRPAVYNEIVTIQSTLLVADEEFLLVETQMTDKTQNHLKAIMRTKFVPINVKTGRKQQHLPEFMEWAKTIENTEVDKSASLQERIKELLFNFKAREAISI